MTRSHRARGSSIGALVFAVFAAGSLGASRTASAATAVGACTSKDGHCYSTDSTTCKLQGGISYAGDWTSCPGLLTGACKLPDGSCHVIDGKTCGQYGGSYMGDNTKCPTGACVFGSLDRSGAYTCTILDPATCAAKGGQYTGDGTVCPPTPTPTPTPRPTMTPTPVPTAKPALAAPTNVTVVKGATSLAVSWTASAGATSYGVVYSKTSGSGYLAGCTTTATTCTIMNLTPGTTYYVGVYAVGPSATSAMTQIVTGTSKILY